MLGGRIEMASEVLFEQAGGSTPWPRRCAIPEGPAPPAPLAANRAASAPASRACTCGCEAAWSCSIACVRCSMMPRYLVRVRARVRVSV